MTATTVELIRCSQKDQQYVDIYSQYLFDIVRLCGSNYRYKLTTFVRPVAQLVYYGLTSVSKLQTLGEEYTGILRFVKHKRNIPNIKINLLWLLFYIGGEDIFYKCLKYYEQYLLKNKSIRKEAKSTLLQISEVIRNNKQIITSLHQALFYINGDYYNISNRLTGIEYIYLRHWMKSDQHTTAIKTLGYLSLLYILLLISRNLYIYKNSQIDQHSEEVPEFNLPVTNDDCFICMEKKLNPSILSCGHIFCWKCIFSIIGEETKCPICREVVLPNGIILIQNY